MRALWLQIIAIVLGMREIWQHWKNYHKPRLQVTAAWSVANHVPILSACYVLRAEAHRARAFHGADLHN